MRLLVLLLWLMPGWAFALTAERENYEPLQTATCQPLSLMSLIESDDCLNVSGQVQAAWLYSTADSTSAYPDAWLRLQSVAQTDFGSFSATARVRSFHFQPVLWMPPIPDTRIDEGYLSFSTDAFTVAAGVRPVGHEGTIANFISDRSQSDALRIDLATGDELGLGGHIVQASFNALENLNISVGIESIETEPKLISVISYDGGELRAHVTAIHGDIYSSGRRNTFLHAGMEYETDVARLVGATVFDDAGNRQALLFGSIWIDDFLVGAGVHEQKWSYSAASTTFITMETGYRFGQDVIVRLSGAQVVGNPAVGDGLLAASIEAIPAEKLRLYGQIGQFWGSIFSSQAIAFYRLEAEYEPTDTAKFGIGIEGNQLGAIKIKSSAKITF